MAESGGDNVLGHYSVLADGTLQPLLPESSPLFRCIQLNDLAAFTRLLDEGAASRVYNVLHWSSQTPEDAESEGAGGEGDAPPRPLVRVKMCTLLHIAAHRAAVTGAMEVLQLLLDAPGCTDPRRRVGEVDVFQVWASALQGALRTAFSAHPPPLPGAAGSDLEW
jgi:hypothetical protein